MHWPVLTPVHGYHSPFLLLVCCECVESCKCNRQSEGSTGNGLISERLAPHHHVVTTCHYPKHRLAHTHKLAHTFWYWGRLAATETSTNPRKHVSFLPHQSFHLTHCALCSRVTWPFPYVSHVVRWLAQLFHKKKVLGLVSGSGT